MRIGVTLFPPRSMCIEASFGRPILGSSVSKDKGAEKALERCGERSSVGRCVTSYPRTAFAPAPKAGTGIENGGLGAEATRLGTGRAATTVAGPTLAAGFAREVARSRTTFAPGATAGSLAGGVGAATLVKAGTGGVRSPAPGFKRSDGASLVGALVPKGMAFRTSGALSSPSDANGRRPRNSHPAIVIGCGPGRGQGTSTPGPGGGATG